MADTIETHAIGLYELAEAERISLRLFGSCAIRVKCAKYSDVLDRCNRYPKDIDCVIPGADRNHLRAVLLAKGWRENVELMAQTDGNRLEFRAPDPNVVLDVSVDLLRFAQTLDVRERIDLDKPTLPAADLLLSKLQIQDVTPLDLIDMMALLYSVPPSDDDFNAIEVRRIINVTGRSWRWHKAVQTSFMAIEQAMCEPVCGLSESDRGLVTHRLGLIDSRIRSAPKTLGWRIRSFFGEVLPWYQRVEI